MQHKGEIIEKAVRESGHSITKLAQKMGKSRRWVYQIFDNANVPIDYIFEIGKIIHHDFSKDIKGIHMYTTVTHIPRLEEEQVKFSMPKEEVEFWKNKYYLLLEKYNELLSNQNEVLVQDKNEQV